MGRNSLTGDGDAVVSRGGSVTPTGPRRLDIPSSPLPSGFSHVLRPRAVPKQFNLGKAADIAWLRAASLRPGCPMIAITSTDGGVGRSTLTAALGGLLALASPQPVLAVDMTTNPWGGLVDRIGRRSDATVSDVLTAPEPPRDLQTLERLVQCGPTGLHALVSEIRVTSKRHPPSLAALVALLPHLRRLYPLALLDLPVAQEKPLWMLMIASPSPVVVARASTESVRHVLQMMTWLRGAEQAATVERTTLVIVETAPDPQREVKAAERTAGSQVRAVHRIPYDPLLARPAPIDVRRLNKPTRSALLELAAGLLQGCAADPELAAQLIGSQER